MADSEMTDRESSSTPRTRTGKRVVRRIFEIITAAALLLAIFYWPTTNAGRIYLFAVVLVALLGIKLLSKWPSA
jgi:hypothetical protein